MPSLPRRRFDAVLFDFGGVITTSPFAALKERGEAAGATAETVLSIVLGPYHQDTEHPWHRLERGEVGLRDALVMITAQAAEAGIDFDPTKLGSFFGPSSVQHEVVDYIRAIREDGYATALVTNNALELRELWRPLVPLAELFDAVIDSCEVGIRKPDPRIFDIALTAIGVSRERAVFVDDLDSNVDAARAIGLSGVVMGADPLPALRAIDHLLGRSVP